MPPKEFMPPNLCEDSSPLPIKFFGGNIFVPLSNSLFFSFSTVNFCMLIFNELLDAASVDGYTGSFFSWTGCHGGGMSTATHDQCAGSDFTAITRNNR